MERGGGVANHEYSQNILKPQIKNDLSHKNTDSTNLDIQLRYPHPKITNLFSQLKIDGLKKTK